MCKSWIDSGFDGILRQRLVNQILGNLCRLHYPGMVTLPNGRGKSPLLGRTSSLLMMETMELPREQCPMTSR
jgi:hypothetical protein